MPDFDGNGPRGRRTGRGRGPCRDGGITRSTGMVSVLVNLGKVLVSAGVLKIAARGALKLLSSDRQRRLSQCQKDRKTAVKAEEDRTRADRAVEAEWEEVR